MHVTRKLQELIDRNEYDKVSEIINICYCKNIYCDCLNSKYIITPIKEFIEESVIINTDFWIEYTNRNLLFGSWTIPLYLTGVHKTLILPEFIDKCNKTSLEFVDEYYRTLLIVLMTNFSYMYNYYHSANEETLLKLIHSGKSNFQFTASKNSALKKRFGDAYFCAIKYNYTHVASVLFTECIWHKRYEPIIAIALAFTH